MKELEVDLPGLILVTGNKVHFFVHPNQSSSSYAGPADVEGEGCPEKLCEEDTEHGREEAKKERGACFEENGVRQAEREGKGVCHHVDRYCPHPQSLRQISKRTESFVFVPESPPVTVTVLHLPQCHCRQ